MSTTLARFETCGCGLRNLWTVSTTGAGASPAKQLSSIPFPGISGACGWTWGLLSSQSPPANCVENPSPSLSSPHLMTRKAERAVVLENSIGISLLGALGGLSVNPSKHPICNARQRVKTPWSII